MKENTRTLLTSIGLVAILAVFQLSPGQAQTRGEQTVKWEYKSLTLQDPSGNAPKEWEEKLNNAGAEGWELVSAISYLKNSNTGLLRVLLKRPKG